MLATHQRKLLSRCHLPQAQLDWNCPFRSSCEPAIGAISATIKPNAAIHLIHEERVINPTPKPYCGHAALKPAHTGLPNRRAAYGLEGRHLRQGGLLPPQHLHLTKRKASTSTDSLSVRKTLRPDLNSCLIYANLDDALSVGCHPRALGAATPRYSALTARRLDGDHDAKPMRCRG